MLQLTIMLIKADITNN